MNITTTPVGSGLTEDVHLDGREVGAIVNPLGESREFLAQPIAARQGTYRFATREDAIAALVSHDRQGYWTREV